VIGTVASPGFVARRGKDGNYVLGQSRWTSGLGAAASRWLASFVTNAVLIERAVSYWHLHQLISQTIKYLDSWLSDLLQIELKKWNCWKSRGVRAPVPHSWRRHWLGKPNRWVSGYGWKETSACRFTGTVNIVLITRDLFVVCYSRCVYFCSRLLFGK